MPDANGKPLRSDANTPSPVLSNTAYDVIKDLVLLGFPAFVIAYSGLGALWEWPDTERWVTTAGIVGVLLGALLKIAQKRYEKLPIQTSGTVILNTDDPTVPDVETNVNIPMTELKDSETVTLRVIDLTESDGNSLE